MQPHHLALALWVLVGACAAEQTRATAVPGGPTRPIMDGKPQAQVDIAATVGDTAAVIALVFPVQAQAVSVDVHGVNGLRVTPEGTLIAHQDFPATSRTELRVNFDASAKQGDLAVSVQGLFNGVQRSRTAAFSVGAGGRATLKESSLAYDAKGRPMVLLPTTP